MKPEEFKKFDDEIPEMNKWIIVTNNIDAKNAHGEMSHVWLTNYFNKSRDGILHSFDESGCKINSLTH